MSGYADFLSMGNWGNPEVMPVAPLQVPTSSYNFSPAPAQPRGFWDSMLSKTNPMTGQIDQGWGMPALAAGKGLFDSFMGLKQYGLYKDQLAQGMREFNLNYDAQRTTTNAALEDRQRARVASNPGAYQSVGEYMDRNGIRKG